MRDAIDKLPKGNEKGINVEGDKGQKGEQKPGSTISFKGEANISTEYTPADKNNGKGELIVKMSQTPTFDKVTINNGGPTLDKDSVTVGGTKITDGHITGIATDKIKNPTDVANKEYVDNKLGNMSQSVGAITQELGTVGAHSAALAALKPLQYDPTEKTQIMAGIGRYKHHNAYALGLAVHSNEDLLLNGGISFSKGSTLMVNAGVTWRVGTDARKEMPEIYRRGPITAMYEMTKVITKLENENQALRDANAKQDEEINAIKEQLKALMAEKK